jgi:hypothetical protein
LSDLERLTDAMIILRKGGLLTEGTTAGLVERHVQVEFISESAALQNTPGLTVAEHDGDRWRAFLYTELCSLEELIRRGATRLRS